MTIKSSALYKTEFNNFKLRHKFIEDVDDYIIGKLINNFLEPSYDVLNQSLNFTLAYSNIEKKDIVVINNIHNINLLNIYQKRYKLDNLAQLIYILTKEYELNHKKER